MPPKDLQDKGFNSYAHAGGNKIPFLIVAYETVSTRTRMLEATMRKPASKLSNGFNSYAHAGGNSRIECISGISFVSTRTHMLEATTTGRPWRRGASMPA